MSGYLLSVIGTVLVCSLLTAIAPEGKTSAVIKGIARLACVLTIISPVLRFFKTGDFGENGEEIFTEKVISVDESFIQYYSEKRVKETELALKNKLEELYAPVHAVRLDWKLEKEEFGNRYSTDCIKIQRICVELPKGIDEEVKEKMSSYLTKNYCSEVLIE